MLVSYTFDSIYLEEKVECFRFKLPGHHVVSSKEVVKLLMMVIVA